LLSFLSFLDPLVNPTFIDRENPPLKVNVSAKTIGIVAAVLGALAILFYLVAIPTVLALGSTTTILGVVVQTHTGNLLVALIGLIVGLIGDLMGTVGGYQMYQGNREGKRLLIYGLVIGTASNLVYNIGLGVVFSWVFGLIVTAIIYYFIVISRWPDEAPLVTTGGSSGAAPPPPPPPPPTAGK
jgi:hypothetical protein